MGLALEQFLYSAMAPCLLSQCPDCGLANLSRSWWAWQCRQDLVNSWRLLQAGLSEFRQGWWPVSLPFLEAAADLFLSEAGKSLAPFPDGNIYGPAAWVG